MIPYFSALFIQRHGMISAQMIYGLTNDWCIIYVHLQNMAENERANQDHRLLINAAQACITCHIFLCLLKFILYYFPFSFNDMILSFQTHLAFQEGWISRDAVLKQGLHC